jgi:hypothetical protein
MANYSFQMELKEKATKVRDFLDSNSYRVGNLGSTFEGRILYDVNGVALVIDPILRKDIADIFMVADSEGQIKELISRLEKECNFGLV